MKNISLLVFLIHVIMLTGCASVKIEHQLLQGMIYDYENEPVSGVDIYIKGKRVAVSDIAGHFSINQIMSYSEYNLVAKKTNYEDSELTFSITNMSQVIYLRMYSSQQLLSIAEEKTEQKKYKEAEEYLQRAKIVGGDSLSSDYLFSIIKYLKNEYDLALESLLKILEKGNDEEYIYLLLADTYEQGFNDLENTKLYLRKYLECSYNPKVEERLKKLEQ